MTPEILWALMFSYRCETVEATYYERRMTEITTRCVSTELTRHIMSQQVERVTYAAPVVKPKPVKKAKKKPTRKKKIRKKRSRRA
jgi:hypothetical protein